MSGDARATIIFDGDAGGAVDAANEVAKATEEAAGELKQMASQAGEVAKGTVLATVAMGAAKAAFNAVTNQVKALIASSEQLQQVQSSLRMAVTGVRSAIAETILTQKEADAVTGTLAAITQTMTARIRESADGQRDYSQTLAMFALDVGIAAVRVAGVLSQAYSGLRIMVLAAQETLERMINSVRSLTLVFLELEQKGVRVVSEALADFARMAGPAIGAIFGAEVRASMDAFAQRQNAVRDSSMRVSEELRRQQEETQRAADSIRREYASAVTDVLAADSERAEQLAGLRVDLAGLRSAIIDGTISEYAFGDAVTSTTGAIRDQRSALVDLTAAAIEAEKARGELARLREANELIKNQMVSDEAMRLQMEADAFAESMARKDLDRQISQTQAIKAAIAERTAAEEEAAAVRLRIMQREAGSAGRVAAAAIARQGSIAENFRLGIARELEARAIQWGIEAGGRYAALDFVGGAAYTAAAGAAAVGSRLLGGSPSAAGSVGAAPVSTTTQTTNVSTSVAVSGIVTPDAVPLVARAVQEAQRQGLA